MTTKTTFHLSITRWQLATARARAWLYQHDMRLIAAPIIVSTLLGLILGVQLWHLVRPVETTRGAQPTQAAIMIIATARAQALPTAVPTAGPRLITAYDQPGGAAFPDPIPLPDVAQWIGRWGDGWIEVVWQPNPVWIRSADLGANLADVRPMPAVAITPAQAQPPGQYQVTNEPPLPSAPIVLTADEQAAVDREFGMTDADRAASLAAHNAQQLAWCEGRQSAYCDAVRQAVQP